MALSFPLPSLRISGGSGLRLLGLASLFLFEASGFAQETYKWSVQYLVDNSQAVFGHPQDVFPRQNRGLAISPDGKSLYAAYLHSFNRSGEVRRIRLDESDYESATVHVLPKTQAKAVAVDPEGRVYLAEIDQIAIYDSRLHQFQYGVDVANSEGVAVTRENGKLVLYASVRSRNVLTRWELTTNNNQVVDATPKGFDGSGEMKIPEAKSLRGVALDKKGRIWIADYDSNCIFRVSNDGKEISASKEIITPICMAFDGDRCFVTQDRERQITITDLDMNPVGTLSVPWEELSLAPLGNNRTGALAGIVVAPGQGFYVSNSGGQTAGQRSTYGKEDRNSGVIDGKFYTDTIWDDNEPILHGVLIPPQKNQNP